jgi:sterol 3beta-glucosyltransferase
MIHFQPSRATRTFPHPLVRHALGANRLSFAAVDQLGWQLLRPFVNPWRREVLGLPKLPLRGPMRRVRDVPALCCFSEAVVPRPPDWPPNVHLTGYWFLDEPAWGPEPGLAAFLAAGPPPVYAGFGSMVPRDPAAMTRTVRAALREAGVRAVVHGGGWWPDEDLFVSATCRTRGCSPAARARPRPACAPAPRRWSARSSATRCSGANASPPWAPGRPRCR